MTQLRCSCGADSEMLLSIAEARHASWCVALDSGRWGVVQRAVVVTGLVQQAIEELHQLMTYEMSSAMALRHAHVLDDRVRKLLVEARNEMAALALILGKETV